jgi:hypothetical protein
VQVRIHDNYFTSGDAGNRSSKFLRNGDWGNAAKSKSVSVRASAAARMPLTHPALLTLSYDSSANVRSTVACRAGVSPAILERLATDDNQWVRGHVAANVGTPTHVLTTLLYDDSLVPQLESQVNPSCPDGAAMDAILLLDEKAAAKVVRLTPHVSVFMWGLTNKSPEIRAKAVANTTAMKTVTVSNDERALAALRECIEEDDGSLLQPLANSLMTCVSLSKGDPVASQADLLKAICAAKNPAGAVMCARSYACPSYLYEAMETHPSEKVREQFFVMKKHYLNVDALLRFTQDPSAKVRCQIPTTTFRPEIQDMLVSDPDVTVRRAVAVAEKRPDVLRMLSNDSSDIVKRVVLNNDRVPVDVAIELSRYFLAHGGYTVNSSHWAKLAPNSSAELYETLTFEDVQWCVDQQVAAVLSRVALCSTNEDVLLLLTRRKATRSSVVANKAATENVLREVFKRDNDGSLRNALKRHPNLAQSDAVLLALLDF